jgi:hypothetical protein
MRIASRFRDYYDCVQAAGQDQSLVYVRNEIVEGMGDIRDAYLAREETKRKVFGSGRYSYGYNLFHKDMYIVGFCGKLYSVISLYVQHGDKPVLCHSAKDVMAFVRANFSKKEIAAFEKKEERKWRGWQVPTTIEGFEGHFEAFDNISIDPDFFKHPIFVFDCQYDYTNKQFSIMWNACLRPYEFFRVLDPYTAFQELQMWLSNIAAPQEHIPPVSDIDMVEAKGFNEWSFRQPPGKKKNRGEK